MFISRLINHIFFFFFSLTSHFLSIFLKKNFKAFSLVWWMDKLFIPRDGCYHVILPGCLAVGGIGSINKLRRKDKIRGVIDLSSRRFPNIVSGSVIRPNGLKTLVIHALDSRRFDIGYWFTRCHEFIDECDDGAVLVHCVEGISRSVTICCAYIMATRQLTAADALKFVKEKRFCAKPNKGFIRQLIAFEDKLFRC